MFKKSNYFTKFLGISIIIVGLIVSSLFGGMINTDLTQVYASSVSSDISSTLFTNPNFSSSSSSNIATVSSWSSISYDGFDSTNYKMGIVDVSKIEDIKADKDALWTNYGLLASPGYVVNKNTSTESSYYKYLMINSLDSTSRAGYKTSSSISLDASSFYRISVVCRTMNDQTQSYTDDDETINRSSDSHASIYLNGFSDDAIESKFVDFETNNTWQTYDFYIETSNFNSESLSLELWLGGNTDNNNTMGAVFFSEITATRYSEDTFDSLTKNAETNDNALYIDLNYDYVNNFTNSSFETGLNGWSILSGSKVTTSNIIERQTIAPFDKTQYNGAVSYNPESNNSAINNTSALFMYNKTSGVLGVQSENITINQSGYYRLSIWASSNCNTGDGATIILTEINSDKDATTAEDVSQTVITIVDKTTNIYSSGWVEYSFYISGNALEDKTVALQLWLGTADSNTTGYVFFDDLRMQEISYDDYSNGSSQSNSTTFALDLTSDTYTITNGFFNSTKNENNSVVYPLKASGWTLTGNTNNTFAGVINTNSTHFENNKVNYGSVKNGSNTIYKAVNPGKLPYQDNDSNNVLMLATLSGNDTVAYESSTFSLSAKTYYRISFYVYTQLSGTYDGGLNITIGSSSYPIQKLTKVVSNSQWTKYSVYVYTSTASETLSITLQLSNAYGYAYFDEFGLYESNESLFTSATLSNTTYKIDLNKESFNNANKWTIAEINGNMDYTTYGATDISNISSISGLNGKNPGSIDNDGVMYLSSQSKVYLYYTSNFTYSLTSKTYYKISVWVKTYDVSNSNNTDCGASVYVTYDGNTEKFANINTQNDENLNNDYIEYSFYIYPTSSTTVTVSLGLGNEENLTAGHVFFDDLSITSYSDETAFNTAFDTQSATNSNSVQKLIGETSKDTSTDDTTDNSSNEGNNNVLMAVSGMITTLAIFIALIGFSIRKFRFRRRSHIKNSYDRRQTLDKQLQQQERINLRQDLIDELQNELENQIKVTEKHNQSIKEKLSIAEKELADEKETINQMLDEVKTDRENLTKQYKEKTSEEQKKGEVEYKNQLNRIAKQEKDVINKRAKYETESASKIQNINNSTLAYKQKEDEIRIEIEVLKNEIAVISKEGKEDYSNYREKKSK